MYRAKGMCLLQNNEAYTVPFSKGTMGLKKDLLPRNSDYSRFPHSLLRTKVCIVSKAQEKGSKENAAEAWVSHEIKTLKIEMTPSCLEALILLRTENPA